MRSVQNNSDVSRKNIWNSYLQKNHKNALFYIHCIRFLFQILKELITTISCVAIYVLKKFITIQNSSKIGKLRDRLYSISPFLVFFLPFSSKFHIMTYLKANYGILDISYNFNLAFFVEIILLFQTKKKENTTK